MARLETQINQIYLTSPENKKTSLVLYEESITSSLQLYIVAELWNMQKKSEATDLKKISDIILRSFRANKKLPAETLFEESLSTINQNLADLAHEGRKTWVGKFSCLICVKGLDNNIYLANNGQTSAWLKRKSEMMEVLPAEKRGNHPLKTFINFTQGKLTDNDSLILTTSNVFNYISFELFSKILAQKSLEESTTEITKILQSSMSQDVGFATFLMNFTKKTIIEQTSEVKPILSLIPEQEIYAPIPEEGTAIPILKPKLKLKLPSIPAIPKFRIPLPSFNFEWFKNLKPTIYFQRLNRAGKFFFISFAVFLLLFLVNLAVYAGRLQDKKAQNRIEQLVEKINENIDQAQSALIYKDENQAIEYLNQTIANLALLEELDPIKAQEMSPKLEQVRTVVNKINTINNPALFLDLKRHPTFLSLTPVGFLFGNPDSNSLSRYDNETLSDYFLLNSLKNPLTAIDYTSTTGVIVSSGSQIFRIDPTLKQFEPVTTIENGDLNGMVIANNAIYTLDKVNDQLVKIAYSSRYQKTVSISGNLRNARDFGVDRDIYILYPDKIVRYVSGNPEAFPLPNMNDQLSNGEKIQVASNLYILESTKKRIIVLNKNGGLVNQIYFPTTDNLTDFYVDEASRSLYLLDDNKLYKVTI